MKRFGRWLVLILVGIGVGSAQTGKMTKARKVRGASRPECAQGAICFSGEVREGQEFRKDLNADLEFVLHLPGGFDVISKHAGGSCNLSSWVANPPLRAHHNTEIGPIYDWSAEQEAQTSPREFRFVTNCADYQGLYDLSQADAGKYLANLNSLAKGQGRLWITDSRVTHSHDSGPGGSGAVEWIKFSVEVRLPNPN